MITIQIMHVLQKWRLVAFSKTRDRIEKSRPQMAQYLATSCTYLKVKIWLKSAM